jgi:citrate lyase subunit beta/citryl-CoA lyase
MAMITRPRRSVLYMPGSNARALEKAKSLPADALILDLEDAVAPDAKAEARAQVCDAVRNGGYGHREVVIRINAIDTPWGLDDLKAAAAAAPGALLIPKINDAADIHHVQQLMNEHGAPAGVALWAMMETPLAILNAASIAATAHEADARLSAWVMGTNDLAKELRCLHDRQREPLAASLSLCVLAGRAYGLALIDGVYNDIKDAEGFAQVCAQGAAFGFDGKTLIHPSQIDVCNDLFSPSADDVAWAKKISEAFAHPDNKTKGAIQVEGRMVERLHADDAKRTLAIAKAIADIAGAVT